MFSLFRKDEDRSPVTVLPPPDYATRRMRLDERMAFRRELAEQLVRECLQAIGMTAADYQLGLVPLDARHHRFSVMLDTTSSWAGQRLDAAAMEARVQSLAYARYGLCIDALYWRMGSVAPAVRPRSRATALTPAWELVSDEEKQALMEAIRLGDELPVLHVGEDEYSTDLLPLDDGPTVRSKSRY